MTFQELMTGGIPLFDCSLEIDVVNVGHGDCTLITWKHDKKTWHCMIDSGDGKPSHTQAILDVLKAHKAKQLDLAIVSHFDTDHIGGFTQLLNHGIKIKQYWSPYTPAFKRYEWLFGVRGIEAVQRATALEKQLVAQNTTILSPLDGHTHTPTPELKIRVFSPPVKLYERLLTGHDIQELFELYPTPLGNLLTENTDYSREGIVNDLVRGFWKRKRGFTVSRNLVREAEELADSRNESFSVDRNVSLMAQERGPEFFGNHVLNDTSLVVKIEVWTGTRWFSMLFPGDLENWVYVLNKHQQDLQSDFYKVSHHGGRVYINSDESADSIAQAIRPTVSSVSATGKHDLPRRLTREALERWSSSILCSMYRGCERYGLNGSNPANEKCCQKSYNCEARTGSLTLKMRNGELTVDVAACQRTFTPNTIPVIQLQQHIVHDSDVLKVLTETEIEKHTKSVASILTTIHKERLLTKGVAISNPVSAEEMKGHLLNQKKNLTTSQVQQIYQYGFLTGKYWSDEGESISYKNSPWQHAYKLPNQAEYKHIKNLVMRKDLLFVPVTDFVSGLSSLLQSLPRESLCIYLEKETAFPRNLIDKYIWPQLAKEIPFKYESVFVTKKNQVDNSWLLLSKKGKKSFVDFLREEMERIPDQDFSTYRYGYGADFEKRYESYVDGSEHFQLLASYRVTHHCTKKLNQEKYKLKEEFYELFRFFRGSSYQNYDYSYTSLRDWEMTDC